VKRSRRVPERVAELTKLGVPERAVPLLGIIELAAAVGLTVGIWWAPLGIASAAGLILYVIGALGSHLRVGDKGFVPAAVLLVLSTAALALRVLSLWPNSRRRAVDTGHDESQPRPAYNGSYGDVHE
jgi:hypothetical protein